MALVLGLLADSCPAQEKEPARKADFSLTAEAFHADCKRDDKAAAAKYRGKSIELEGEILILMSGPSLNFKVSGDFVGVGCVLTEKNPFARLCPGQRIKARGQWAEVSGYPAIVKATLVEVGPNPAIQIAAADLAKEYAANPEPTKQRYASKWLLISGEIRENKIRENSAEITLKGTDKIIVKCVAGSGEHKLAQPFKVGDKVKILGEFSGVHCDATMIALIGVIPVGPDEAR